MHGRCRRCWERATEEERAELRDPVLVALERMWALPAERAA
jgi:hypothetical protein